MKVLLKKANRKTAKNSRMTYLQNVGKAVFAVNSVKNGNPMVSRNNYKKQKNDSKKSY